MATVENLLSAHLPKTLTIPHELQSGLSFCAGQTMELLSGERIRRCDGRARIGRDKYGEGIPKWIDGIF